MVDGGNGTLLTRNMATSVRANVDVDVNRDTNFGQYLSSISFGIDRALLLHHQAHQHSGVQANARSGYQNDARAGLQALMEGRQDSR